ncbi:MAG: transglycosylase SLT domain-containing protein [Nitrospirota bacterium]
MIIGVFLISILLVSSPVVAVEQEDTQKNSISGDLRGVGIAPEELLMEAVTNYRNGNLKEAEERLKVIIEKSISDDIWGKRAVFLLGKLYIETRRYEDGRDYLKWSIKGYPELSDYALFYIAESYSKEVREQSTVNGERRTSLHRALDTYRLLEESHPRSILVREARFNAASLLFESGDYASARASFNKYLNGMTDNKLTLAYLQIGRCLIKEGNPLEASEVFKQLYIKYPETPEAEEAKRESDTLVKEGIQIKEPSADELFKRAQRLYDLNNNSKALAEFKDISEKFPDYYAKDQVMLRMGMTMFRMKRCDDAIPLLLRTYEDNQNKASAPEALYYLARCYQKKEDKDKFINTGIQLITAYPTSRLSPAMYILMAEHYRREGDSVKSEDTLMRLLRQYPKEEKTVEKALWMIGWIHYLSGKYHEGLKVMGNLIAKFPDSKDLPQYLYWQGRIYEKIGNREAAVSSYKKLTQIAPYTFYGYRVEHRGQSTEDRGVRGKDNNISIEGKYFPKIEELIVVGLREEATAELDVLRGRLKDKGQIKEAGDIYLRLGEYRKGINIIERGFNLRAWGNDTKIWRYAYPLGYWEVVRHYATQNGLDPYLVASVIREESRFDPTAVSPSGAIGLMQLMPFTGVEVSKKLRLNNASKIQSLFIPRINITLGTWYLKHLLERFKGDLIFSIAGYNAGPEAVVRWINKNRNLTSDEFIEEIPYSETRNYVKNVLKSYAEYKRIHGDKIVNSEQ